MFLKNWLSILVAILVVVGMANPVFSETATEQYNRRVSGNGWTPEQEKCYQSTGKYYNSVIDLHEKVQAVEADVIRREAEVADREAQLQQQQSVPPAGEFAPVPQPENRLVYRTLYYPYNDGCIVVSGWYPFGYVWPGWWYVGLPPYSYPVYGWCRGYWDRGRQSIVVNNIMVEKSISGDSFRRDVGRAFNERHAAPEFARRSPAFRSGVASEHAVGRPATHGVLNSGQRGHQQQFQPRQAMQQPRPNIQQQPQGQFQPRGNNTRIVQQPAPPQNVRSVPQKHHQLQQMTRPPQQFQRPQMQARQVPPPAKQQNNQSVPGGRH